MYIHVSSYDFMYLLMSWLVLKAEIMYALLSSTYLGAIFGTYYKRCRSRQFSTVLWKSATFFLVENK